MQQSTRAGPPRSAFGPCASAFAPVPALALALTLALALACNGAQAAQAFGFADVAREAERLARLPYREPPAADPAITALGYDAHRRQRFRAELSTWRGGGTPFELQYFPLGNGITRPLAMYEVVDGAVQPFVLPPGAFENTEASSVAGWRLNRWIETPRRSDEVGAFLGSSYFRLVAHGLQYGVSARGLAGATPPGALPTWRVTLDFERVDASQPVELRAFLRSGSRTLSETWSHAGAPE